MAMTERNRRLFIHEGYTFTHTGKRSKDGEDMWECQHRRNPRCKVRIRSNGEQGEETYVHRSKLHEHNHAPQPAKVEACRTRAHLKNVASASQDSTGLLLAQAKAMLTNPGKAALGSDLAVKKMIRRRRNKAANAPPNPANRIELEIPDNYKTYEAEPGRFEAFLLYDSGPGENRILIFGAQHNIRRLNDCVVIHCDGTFLLAPVRLFEQIYVIHGKLFGRPRLCQQKFRRLLKRDSIQFT